MLVWINIKKHSEGIVKENLNPAPSSWCGSKGKVVQILYMFNLFPLPGREDLRIFWGLKFLYKAEGDAQHPTDSGGATTGQGLLQEKSQESRKSSKKFGGPIGRGRANRAAAPGYGAKVFYWGFCRREFPSSCLLPFLTLKDRTRGKFSTGRDGTEKYPSLISHFFFR